MTFWGIRERERLGEGTSSTRGEGGGEWRSKRKDWEREHHVRGERGGIGGKKRHDLVDVSLPRLWEITDKRLIMLTSTLVFFPKNTAFSYPALDLPILLLCAPHLPPLLYQSRSLAIGHTHTDIQTESE